LSNKCQDKDKGQKGYECNKFGHISKDCVKIDKSGVVAAIALSLQSIVDITHKEVAFENKKFMPSLILATSSMSYEKTFKTSWTFQTHISD